MAFLISTLVLAPLLAAQGTGQTEAPNPSQNQLPTVRPFPTVPQAPPVQITNTPADQSQLPEGAKPATVPPGFSQEPDIEFQEFVAASLGYRLPIFGQNLFQNVPTTFAPLDLIPVSPDYLIGPGDELLVRAWGQIEINNYHAVVDRNGAIFMPKVGEISVAGLRFGQLNDYLKSAIGRVYKGFDVDVTLGRLRSIQIFVVGQVKRPGAYTVSSLSTLVNALFASGGPAKRGSMRDIQLKRAGKVVASFDLYDLIVKGDKSTDASLTAGDVIYVPPAGPLVALAGSVNVQAIFELKGQDTLGSVMSYAGGLTTTAAGQRVILERIDARQVRSADEVPLTSDGLRHELKDGDIVRFLHISPRFENAITLRGNVAIPGRYPWRTGMRVRDLIPSREALVTYEYWKRQNGLALNPADQSSQFVEAPPVSPRPPSGNAANAPAQQPDPNARINQEELKNQIKRSTAEINWEYAVIQRMDPGNLTSHLLPFNLGKAIEGDESQNLPLQAGDVITIFSQSDMQVPIAQQNKFVRLEGEFRFAGVYQVQPGERLRELIERVGGLTPQAYLFGSDLTRESVRIDQQQRLDAYVNGLERALEESAAATKGASGSEAAAAQNSIENQRRTLDKMRQLRATGRIVLEVKPTDKTLAAIPDLVLEDGDRLVIPFRPATVNVTGLVYNANAFLYKPGKTVADYLRLSGGVSRAGDKKHSFVIRANGSTISNQHHGGFVANNFNNLRMMPGDTLVVPENLAPGAFLRGLKDWSQLFQQFALGAAGIAVLLP